MPWGGNFAFPSTVGPAGAPTWVNILNFGADPTGVADSTGPIQNAWESGFPVYHPKGLYRVSQLTWQPGLVAFGDLAGSYPGDNTIPGVTVLARLATTNLDLITVPDGTNYGRLQDIAIDGNRNNNTTGRGFAILDGSAGQETQIIIERCFIHDNPDSNVYLGNNRRANKISKSVLYRSANGDGVTVAGSDNTIDQNIVGSNGRGGVVLGTTITQNWAATTNFPCALAHVTNNDIFGNEVGVAVASSASDCMVTGNGIDRHTLQGVTVYSGDSNTITGNSLHSNGTSANNTYAHIDLGPGVTQVALANNNFGPQDGGIANVASWCVFTESGIPSATILGNIGVFDSTSSVNGLLSAAGANTSPSVLLSKGGGIVQGNNTTQHVFLIRNAAGTTLFDMDNAGTFSVFDGAGKFLATLFIGEVGAPATPTGGGVLYVDLTGHLHYLGPGGTDTTLANP